MGSGNEKNRTDTREVKMKKLIIAVALLLASVTVANAEGLRCEIVQVLPGIFLPQCESSYRHVSRNYYRGDNVRWRYERGSRHNRHNRHDRYYYGKKRHPRMDKDIYDRPHRRDNHRW